MEKRNYCFAGVEYQIVMPEELMYKEERCLGHFAVESVTDPHIFTFELCENLTPPGGRLVAGKPSFCVYEEDGASVRYIGSVAQGWENGYIRAYHKGREHRIQLKKSQFADRIGTHTVLSALAAEHLVVQAGGVVFHCSYIETDGKAVLFTAPSETGKSTQADLWHLHRNARIINGDRAAVRLADGVVCAAGLPFAGSSSHCRNRTLPLAAIVYLAQAPSTSIRRLTGYEAFARVWEGISVNTWDRDDIDRASRLVQQIARQVPVFYMPCTPDESAVITLEKALKGEI